MKGVQKAHDGRQSPNLKLLFKIASCQRMIYYFNFHYGSSGGRKDSYDFFSSDISTLQLGGTYLAKTTTNMCVFGLPQSLPGISNPCHFDFLLAQILHDFESLKPPLGAKCQQKLWLIQAGGGGNPNTR